MVTSTTVSRKSVLTMAVGAGASGGAHGRQAGRHTDQGRISHEATQTSTHLLLRIAVGVEATAAATARLHAAPVVTDLSPL